MNDPGQQAAGHEACILRCESLERSFEEGGRVLRVLQGLNLEVARGERIAIIGESGAGKTTLLQLLGGLDLPTSGRVFVDGQDIAVVSDAERGRLRNRVLGFVYQFHHLLPEFSALENVAMPLLVRREPAAAALAAAAELLERVGLSDRARHRPGVVLADEPTGNLDHGTGDKVFELMLALNREYGSSLVVVTHDLGLAARMDRVLSLENGTLVAHKS